MKHSEVILIAVVAAVAVNVLWDFTRAKGARAFNRGKNGENALLFDPASAPQKPPGT